VSKFGTVGIRLLSQIQLQIRIWIPQEQKKHTGSDTYSISSRSLLTEFRTHKYTSVVAGKCRPYMSSLIYCNQTKYGNKQSLLWNLCVLLTYIFLLLRIVKFYTSNYTGDPLRSTRSLHAVYTCQKSHSHAKSTRVVVVVS
jgi:hypothetical protein